MIKSLKITLIILLSIFILDKIVYFTLKKIDDKVLTGHLGRMNQYFMIKDTTKYLFFGSSRTHHHINPSLFSKSSYNIGVGGTKSAHTTALIKTLPKDKEQFIFVQIDPTNVFDTLYDGSDIKSLNIMQHKNASIRNSIKELEMDNPFSIFLWSLDYNGVALSLISNWLRPKYDYKNFNGYEPVSNTEEQKQIFINRLASVKKVACEQHITPSLLERKSIVEILEFCKKNNKHLLFFTSPVYKKECVKGNLALKKLMDDYDANYVDFTTLFDENPDLDLWKDENHLSKKGADLFSEIMAEQVAKKLK